MTFELGKVSDRIIEGELEKKDVVAVKISEDITSLINALMRKCSFVHIVLAVTLNKRRWLKCVAYFL